MKVKVKCGGCGADLGTFVVSGKEADVEVHACEHCDKLTFTLVCDPKDYAAIREAIARRNEYSVPESASGYNGARIAEICRGYLGMLGEKE